MRNPYIEVFHQDEAKRQCVFRFNNGYGASIACGPKTIGGSEGLWELAAVRFRSESPLDFYVDATTNIGADLHGHLTEPEVEVLLTALEYMRIDTVVPTA